MPRMSQSDYEPLIAGELTLRADLSLGTSLQMTLLSQGCHANLCFEIVAFLFQFATLFQRLCTT